jgi:hypothetical protein
VVLQLRTKTAWIVLAVLASGLASGADYEVGGPAAGVQLPLFPTQHGEPAGQPGGSDGYPEYELYPGSVEHFRSVGLKNLPVRPLWDRQTQVRNFLAHQLPGLGENAVEPYAAPVYKVNRYGTPTLTDRKLRPVNVVRCRAQTPKLGLDLGELTPSLYAIRVIGAVPTDRIRPFREPLYLSMKVNDGLRGEETTYRLRIGYCDEFYSVAEFYFHATERRHYRAEVSVDKGSAVELLVHNISLDDMLAGLDRRAIKTHQTIATPEEKAVLAAGLPAEQRRVVDNVKPLTPEERLARDEAIWKWFPPINAQGATLLNSLPTGVAGKTGEQITEEFGSWEYDQNVDHSRGMVLSYDPARQRTLLTNKKMGLSYTVDDWYARKPLPDPYPYKDDGAGLFYPDPKDPAKGVYLAPIAAATQSRYRDAYFGYGGLGNSYGRIIYLSGNKDLMYDAALSLIRYAWQFPTVDSANFLTELAAASPNGYDMRTRQRHDKAYWMAHYQLYEVPIRDYDLLFPFIRGNEQLAQSVARFIPWVRDSSDLIKLLDVYLVQFSARRTMRYLDVTVPTGISTMAAALGDTKVTDPWMEWLFSRTSVYPLPPAGLQDVMISGNDREGAQYLASAFYSRGEAASYAAAALDRYRAAGGNSRFDLSNAAIYPKPLAHCQWLLRTLTGGCDAIRIGDVNGPGVKQGAALASSMEGFRNGWRWSGDPRFAWMIVNLRGRKGESDDEWNRLSDAAAALKRAPWLDQRSRSVENWGTTLETGVEHDDFRFRRSVMVRTGAGVGHQHSDALDLQVFAHGMCAVMDGGQRGGYSEPSDRMTRIHNLVEVDGRDHLAYGWTQALSDASGARYLRAEAIPPAGCTLFRRQTALVDVDEGKGSQVLSAEQQKPGARLSRDVTTPNSYVFDVFRVTGGKVHSYCCHGTVNDAFEWNAVNTRPVAHVEKESGETDSDDKYLSPFQLSKDKKFAADAPELLQATWRQVRFEKDTQGGVSEEAILGPNFSPETPRRFTRWHLFGMKGMRALQAPVVMHKAGYQWTAMMVLNRSAGKALDSAYPAIVEPYVGVPFITAQRQVVVEGNEEDALRAVAVGVETANGRKDLCFADGRPDKIRHLGAIEVSGEFALVSVTEDGLVRAALTGGTRLSAPEVRLSVGRREWTGTIRRVEYHKKTIWIDQSWPGVTPGQVLEITGPTCKTSYTVASVKREGEGCRIVLTHGADFYRAPVTQVLPEANRVDGRLFLPPGRESISGMTVSNDTMTKFWRVQRNKGNDLYLDGTVAASDFAPSGAVRIWEYGVGDNVRLATFVGVHRTADGAWEVTGNADAEVTIGKGPPHRIIGDELGANGGSLRIGSADAERPFAPRTPTRR